MVCTYVHVCTCVYVCMYKYVPIIHVYYVFSLCRQIIPAEEFEIKWEDIDPARNFVTRHRRCRNKHFYCTYSYVHIHVG